MLRLARARFSLLAAWTTGMTGAVLTATVLAPATPRQATRVRVSLLIWFMIVFLPFEYPSLYYDRFRQIGQVLIVTS